MRAGYEEIAPPVIQPAGPFLDAVGEALRGRTYDFVDPDGDELCLRPNSPYRPAGFTAPPRRPGAGALLLLRVGFPLSARRRYRHASDGVSSSRDRVFAAPDGRRRMRRCLVSRWRRCAGRGSIGSSSDRRSRTFRSAARGHPHAQALAATALASFLAPGLISRVLMRLTSPEALKSHDLPHELVERLIQPTRGRRAFSWKISRPFRRQADWDAHAAGSHRTPPRPPMRAALLGMTTAGLIESFTLEIAGARSLLNGFRSAAAA